MIIPAIRSAYYARENAAINDNDNEKYFISALTKQQI